MGYLPNKAPRCSWSAFADPATSPHTKRPWELECCKIYPNVLTAVGSTPLVKLNRIPKAMGLKCNIYVKCEYMNPCCSVKDRVAHRAIQDAEELGTVTPETTILEPSTGNTAIGFAMVCSIKGYRCVAVMPERTSPEKVALIKALGAEVVLCPNTATASSPDGIFGRTHTLLNEMENSIKLDQFSNSGNPLSHYDGTAEEILWALDKNVHMVVAGCGTGGTLSGIGRKMKEVDPDIEIVGADPEASELARPVYLNKTSVPSSEVEGIGFKGMTPTTLDRKVIDRWIKVSDKDTFRMARRLMSEEGLFCGGTSGTAVFAAICAARDLEEGKNVVVILSDAVRYYLGRYTRDPWMEIRQYNLCFNTNQLWWWNINLQHLQMTEPRKLRTCNSCHRALHEFYRTEAEHLPMINEDGHLLGIISKTKLAQKLIYGQLKPNDLAEKALVDSDIPKVTNTTTLGVVSKAFQLDDYCVVYRKKLKKGTKDWIDEPIGMLTAFDLLHYIANHRDNPNYGKY